MSDEKRSGRVRHPDTIYVDKIEFEPVVDADGVTRTAHDLELTEFDMRKLHEFLGKRLEGKFVFPARIRVIGRQVS